MKFFVKDISISKYLFSCGFSPKSKKPGVSWFTSPLRPGDREPSFKVDESKNLWHDFGTGAGGSIIDLVMVYHGYNFSQAVAHLEGHKSLVFSFTEKQPVKSGMELIEITRLKSESLISYLTNERKINLDIARRYVCEARYKANGNIYNAISFRNDLGGYELRNQIFKGAISPKHYTTIPGQAEGINIFEGFIDFLSALTLYKTINLKYTSIVLNSLTNVSKLPDLSTFPAINLFLDNDQAGITSANQLIQKYSQAKNESGLLFPGYKDFNDFLTNKLMIE